MTNIEQVLNSEKSSHHAEALARTMHIIQLHNDYIDQVQSPHKISPEDARVSYAYLYKALGNMHELNQSLMNDLDNAAVYLHDVAEEQKENEDV